MKVPQLNEEFRHSFHFTKEQVTAYANLSGDTNPIHVSDDYGDESTFGRCIVHGYFTNSIFSKVYGTLLYPDGNILVEQRSKFIKPIFTDISYIAVFTVIKLLPEKNRVTYSNEIFDAEIGELKVTGEATLWNKEKYKW